MSYRSFTGALTCAVLLICAVAPASQAVAPKNGWGMAVADDDAIGSPQMPPTSLNTSRFALLRPKTFRFQIYWNAVDDTSNDYIARARAQIKRARDVGVQQVVATFRKNGATPTAAQYKQGITKVVTALATDVDVWGPANEPNGGQRWLPLDENGPQKLAAFNNALIEVVNAFDHTALRTSPDFIDTPGFESYITAYRSEGGGWGHYIAFHPYEDANQKSRASVNTLAGMNGAGGKEIWITEIGFGRGHGGGVFDQTIQNQKTNWMVNGETGKPALASHANVTRIYYYDMTSSGDPGDWDTALLNANLTPRPAWTSWCAASHGGNAAHADCSANPPGVGGDLAAIGGDGSVWLKAGLLDGPWTLAGGPEFAARDIDLSGNRLVTATGNGAVWLKEGLPGGAWNLMAGTEFDTRDVELDGGRLAAVTGNGTVFLKDGLPGAAWDAIGGPEFATKEISLDGNRLALIAGNGAVWLKDGLPGGAWHLSGGPEFAARDIELSGNRLAVAMGNGSVWMKEGLPGGPWLLLGGTEFNARDIDLDGNRLAVATGDGAVWLKDGLPSSNWSLMAGTEFNTRDLDLDGNRLAAATGNGAISLKNGVPGAPWTGLAGTEVNATQVALP